MRLPLLKLVLYAMLLKFLSVSACDVRTAQLEIGPKISLGLPASIDEIELKYTIRVVVDGKSVNQPFGFSFNDWVKFKREYKKGDCIVEFDSIESEWKHLRGARGYVLIRDGKVVATFLISIS